MVAQPDLFEDDDLSRQLSVYGLQRTLLREKHCEVAVLPYLLKITKTDFGVSLGLPPKFWNGSYTKGGEEKMIRLQDVIHKGAWKKSLERPEEHNLPPGFTIVHFSLTRVATHFTRFFLDHYSKQYRTLPKASKVTLYHAARACSIWESFEEKVLLEEQGLEGFACHEVYERFIEGRSLFKDYPLGIKMINGLAKAYRNSNGKYGISPVVHIARRASLYTHMNEQVEKIATRPLSLSLPSLPPGIPPFKLLEPPPASLFAEGEE